MKTQSIIRVTVVCFTIGMMSNKLNASTPYYSRASGDWNTNSSWSTVTYGGTAAVSHPVAGDIARIKGHDIDVNDAAAACADLYMYGDGSNDAKLDIEEGNLLSISGNVTLDANGGSKKVHFHLKKVGASAGDVTIGGFLLATRAGGSNDIEIKVDDDGILTVTGNMTLDFDGGTKDIKVDVKDNGRINVNGDLTLDYSAGTGFIDFNAKNSSIVDLNGDLIFVATAQSKSKMTFDNSTKLYLAGDLTRSANPNNYGYLEFKSGTTMYYDGSTQRQNFGESGGAGTDGITYMDVTLSNSFGTSPQLSLENNEGGGATISGTLTFSDGVLTLGSQNLIIGGNGTTTGASQNSYVDATLSNGGVFRKNISGVMTYTFPVGDGDDYSPFTYQLASVNGCTYLTCAVSDATHVNLAGAGDPSSSYVSRFWRVNSSGCTSATNHNVSYNYTDSDVVNTESAIVTHRWNGTSWTGFNVAITGTNTLSTSGGLGSIPLNHDFTGASASALPVEFLDFTGKYNSGKVVLDWKTASEKNNKGFTVQISSNGKEYQDLGFVKGAGNSTKVNSYSYTDLSKKTVNVYYYRLKQEDTQGNAKYSKTIDVVNETEVGQMEVSKAYPNPAAGSGTTKINITLPTDGKVTIQVYNMMGQKVKEVEQEMEAGNSILEISDENLASGTYAYTISFNLNKISGKFMRLSTKTDSLKSRRNKNLGEEEEEEEED